MPAGDNLSNQFYGRGMEALFPEGSAPIRTAPWPSAGRRKDRRDYDPDIVREAITSPPVLSEVDPRNLRATQPMITHQGVDYYYNDPTYEATGRTFADPDNPGNKYPVVYKREDGQNLLLSGHHRAAADLAKGRNTRAIVREGPWGPQR